MGGGGTVDKSEVLVHTPYTYTPKLSVYNLTFDRDGRSRGCISLFSLATDFIFHPSTDVCANELKRASCGRGSRREFEKFPLESLS